MSEGPEVLAYTDGACSRNPGPGGWGVLLIAKEKGVARFLSGFEKETTNNRMELRAAIEALKSLKGSLRVELHTDSKYLKDGIEKWIHNWKRRNWRNSSNHPVVNQDLWVPLDELNRFHHVRWGWVKGHASNRYNNFVDKLATQAISRREGVDKRINLQGLERLIDE